MNTFLNLHLTSKFFQIKVNSVLFKSDVGMYLYLIKEMNKTDPLILPPLLPSSKSLYYSKAHIEGRL